MYVVDQNDIVVSENLDAPDFTLPAVNKGSEQDITLSSFRGKKVVLYFYPKDDTPGCTMEAKDFRDNYEKFTKLNTIVIGVSKDSLGDHKNFCNKYSLPFTLLADVEGKLCERYGAWVQKSMFGKKYMGIDRSTILIDENGKIINIWRKVKVKNHVKEVLKRIEQEK